MDGLYLIVFVGLIFFVIGGIQYCSGIQPSESEGEYIWYDGI